MKRYLKIVFEMTHYYNCEHLTLMCLEVVFSCFVLHLVSHKVKHAFDIF